MQREPLQGQPYHRISVIPLSELARARPTYISGFVMPFVALAQSLCVLTDIIMDSVPPDVVVPAPVGLLYLTARNHSG